MERASELGFIRAEALNFLHETHAAEGPPTPGVVPSNTKGDGAFRKPARLCTDVAGLCRPGRLIRAANHLEQARYRPGHDNSAGQHLRVATRARVNSGAEVAVLVESVFILAVPGIQKSADKGRRGVVWELAVRHACSPGWAPPSRDVDVCAR